jgi:hypothetical protein
VNCFGELEMDFHKDFDFVHYFRNPQREYSFDRIVSISPSSNNSENNGDPTGNNSDNPGKCSSDSGDALSKIVWDRGNTCVALEPLPVNENV